MFDIETLYEYQKEIKKMCLEGLLNELERQVGEKAYNRFISKNENLVNECKDRILIIKLRILEIAKNDK